MPSCRWCGRAVVDARKDAIYCGPVCRKRAFRFRDRMPTALPPATGRPIVVVYADPPYVEKAFMYEGQEDFAGEVDHADLLRRLEEKRLTGQVDGWALSCSVASLRYLLPLCPEGAKVCAWVKPMPIRGKEAGVVVRWEAVLVVGGRVPVPAVADFLNHLPARDASSDLVGRKPPAFSAWLFTLLGMRPGDELQDWFPGTGQVLRAWQEWCSRPASSQDESRPEVQGDVSPRGDTPEAVSIETGRLQAGHVDAGRLLSTWCPGRLVPSLAAAGRVSLVEGTVPPTSGTPEPGAGP